MIDMFRALGERGETALRRGLWALSGAGLIVLALGFAAGAGVEWLATMIPRYAALACGAAALLLAGLFCFARAPKHEKPSTAPTTAAPVAGLVAGDWKTALHLALVEEARERPARAAALAALAGLILGALDGLEDKRAGRP